MDLEKQDKGSEILFVTSKIARGGAMGHNTVPLFVIGVVVNELN